MEKKEYKDNIVTDAYYLINLFHGNDKKVTQLHIQKLMFLFEAYYMNKYNVDELYKDLTYKAWAFGPVATPLYKRFKEFGDRDIIITEEEKENGNSINEQKRETMDELYNTFKELNATQLVNFTHAEGSPWKTVWNNSPYESISKKSIKEWFSKYVSK